MSKLEQVQKWTQDNKVDFTYISDPKTIQYLTGFYSDPIERVLALIVFNNQDPFMFAPALEVQAIKETGFPYPVYGYLDHEDPWQLIAQNVFTRIANPREIALEKDQLQVARLEQLQRVFPAAAFNADITSFINELRVIKSADEIEKLKVAGKWADFAFEQSFKAVKAGRTEQEVVAELQYALMKKGIMQMSFDTLVQAGAHAAEPHGATNATKFQTNELVLFDLGTIWDGYISDASRTVALGTPTDKELDMYQVCLEAQLTAQAAVKPGLTAAKLDKIARDVISKAGYGDYFIHRLGHGMGMSEHEFPSIMAGNDMVLKPGMCFSIEPGIYIPDVAGVRIEDCVVVTDTGCEPFTHTSKELTYVG
ncbi:proline dipeptidase [Secundilactobacillus kimchicus JCM 15530]|uniref:Proline dipeptidase n=1 Tax=Secundilactobacillus kimchicus JCM 15530 TaxID=1302272 RepID=A0A0R1HLE6_9LACO|nr:Xaa-Pro peptidase family protein [Secundilactobacillus kimchicus]KRK47195.1 proline dipeptidase [Secundilactobacillus kimchicus JCM 15530]